MLKQLGAVLSGAILIFLLCSSRWAPAWNLSLLQPLYLIPLLAVSMLQIHCCALKWYYVAGHLGVTGTKREFVRCNVWASLTNQVTPTSFAGEAARYLWFRRTASKKSLVLSQVWDRVSTHLVWGLALVLASKALMLALLAAGLIYAFRDQVPPGLWKDPRTGLLALAINGAVPCALYFSGLALSAPVDLYGLLLKSPFILAALAVPFFFSGWGIREASLAYFAADIGIGSGQAVAMSICYGLMQLMATILCLAFCYLAPRR